MASLESPLGFAHGKKKAVPKTHAVWYESLCCDCVEWCPVVGFEDLFVVCNYELQKDGSCGSVRKIGGLSLFRAIALSDGTRYRMDKVCHVECAAVLDAKWCPLRGLSTPLLAVGCETGDVLFYTVETESVEHCRGTLHAEDSEDTHAPVLTLSHKCTLSALSESSKRSGSALRCCLYLDWRISRKSEEATAVGSSVHSLATVPSACDLVVSMSDGSFSLVTVAFSNESTAASSVGLSVSAELLANSGVIHADQMWCVCFDHYNDALSVVFSGADDCKLHVSDLRLMDSSTSGSVVLSNGHSHDGGICCVEDSWRDAFTLYTGSYDEHLRAFDKRKLSKPLCERRFADGVWRIKAAQTSDLLLIGAMRGGFHVLRHNLEPTSEPLSVVCEYNAHSEMAAAKASRTSDSDSEEVLAYGCDWQRSAAESGSLIASCSFYDKAVHLWTFGNYMSCVPQCISHDI